MCGDRGHGAVCWGVHMQRMDERMTRACATREHICADVVPTVRWCDGALMGPGAVKVPCACVARGVHTGSCVGVQVHGAAVGRAGEGAAVGCAGEGAAVGRAGGSGAGAALRGARTRGRGRAARPIAPDIALYDTLVSVLGSSGHRVIGASQY